MKSSFHWYHRITSEEVQRLEKHYRRQGVTTQCTLNIDPRFFDLAVSRPEVKYLKPTPRSMRNKIWD